MKVGYTVNLNNGGADPEVIKRMVNDAIDRADIPGKVEALVPPKVDEAIGTKVPQMINDKLNSEAQAGNFREVVVFDSRENSVGALDGRQGVEYIDKATGLEYYYNGTDYVQINETANEEEIENLLV